MVRFKVYFFIMQLEKKLIVNRLNSIKNIVVWFKFQYSMFKVSYRIKMYVRVL